VDSSLRCQGTTRRQFRIERADAFMYPVVMVFCDPLKLYDAHKDCV